MVYVFVQHDNMNHDIVMGYKINRAIKLLGLNKKEVEHILKNNSVRNEIILWSNGPNPYDGAYYGTISINDF